MQKPLAWAVLETPPNAAYPNGFSPRWEAFLSSLRDRFTLELFAIHQPDAGWRVDEFVGDGLAGVSVTVEEAGFNPLNLPGTRGRVRRLAHYATGRMPQMSHPVVFPHLESRLGKDTPALVISFLPSTAQIVERLPRSIPVIAVLEEGWDRALTMSAKGRGRHAWAASRGAIMLQRLYRRVGDLGHTIVVISRDEVDWFAQFVPRAQLRCIPHAIDCRYFAASDVEPDIDVAVFGDLSQARNYEPARKLFDTLSRRATATKPLKWAFVGRNPHGSISELQGENVIVTGFVPDIREWYDRTRVVVAPTKSGAGVKTTVLQAWSMGKPVVATQFSVSGLEFNDGRDLLVGKTDDEMATHVLELLSDSSRARELGVNGRERARSGYDIRLVVEQFADLCAETAGLPAQISADETGREVPEDSGMARR